MIEYKRVENHWDRISVQFIEINDFAVVLQLMYCSSVQILLHEYNFRIRRLSRDSYFLRERNISCAQNDNYPWSVTNSSFDPDLWIFKSCSKYQFVVWISREAFWRSIKSHTRNDNNKVHIIQIQPEKETTKLAGNVTVELVVWWLFEVINKRKTFYSNRIHRNWLLI